MKKKNNNIKIYTCIKINFLHLIHNYSTSPNSSSQAPDKMTRSFRSCRLNLKKKFINNNKTLPLRNDVD